MLGLFVLLGGVPGCLSWSALVVGELLGFLLGFLLGSGGRRGGAGVGSGRADREAALPFGPFMIAGALIAVFADRPIADLWLPG